MQRLQAYRFELQPNGKQQRQMRRFAGSCRFVYNKALALQQERHKAGEKNLGYAALCKALTEWKAQPQTLWLSETPSQTLQQALKNLERAYKNFFEKRADFPRFKKKGMGDSFRYPQGVKLDQGNSRVFLPKLGWLRYRNSRGVLGEVKNATVSHSCGKWFVSIQTEREVDQPLPQGEAVGIDMGIARFATLSDGSYLDPLNSFKKHQQRLARYQRAMSRKVKFSNNWKKAKTNVQRIHTRIANARKDFLHKASCQISQNHAMIAIEDLRIRNMSKSARGNSEQHGKMVKQKSGLNRSILDQGWFEFRRQLEYKSAWNGGFVVAVPPQYTSQTCPCCGHVSKDNRQTQARFECVDCGFEENADLVGAINILARGHRVLACGETVQSGRSVKQEPAEATQAIAA
ncbi:RNA-guided endonuclease InsQ/TnpB family protein [Undibacterium oligocarboniphilum]|jgi:putative transposase|uniref:IS200/IS605 family element transposase accessory protein TnpB n=1 Tax=Undibacterium oligocarboniphilum TaxID=666702 RepID=A0A850QMT1_9BURK|nr:RNA-guided endonuclease TnpB family protein [Undibacterium oligocarboniphilum]MBC3871479.1 IS200/IS605 family element transposase accessory protein TnpB [Undibacterium oligocarboniphilum]NVO78945.1 IS200/IS605 family element transposase accessory protein TnpB [Undibacterium oligocarboniphilum]